MTSVSVRTRAAAASSAAWRACCWQLPVSARAAVIAVSASAWAAVDRRVSAGAGGCCLSLGLPGACLGGLLQVAGGFQGFQGGVQFLVSLGGLGMRDGGGCLSATAAGVGVGQLRADLCPVSQGSFGAGEPGQRGAVAQDSLQPGQRVFAWPGRPAVRLGGRDAVIRAAGAAGAGRVVVSAGARIAAVLPRQAVAGRQDRGAAAGPAAVTHQVTGLAGDQAGACSVVTVILFFLFFSRGNERKRDEIRGIRK